MSVMPQKPVARVTAATSFLLSPTLSNRLEEEEADDDRRPLLSSLPAHQSDDSFLVCPTV